jgi:predicted HTH domain antitoxin
MPLTLQMPPSVEQAVREAWGDRLDGAAMEALLIAAYREGKISVGKLAEVLELSTAIEAEGWLAARGLNLNYTAEDFAADCRSIDTLRSTG